MYGALWRVLPGPWPIKVLILLALFAAAVWALFEYGFPWLQDVLGLSDVSFEYDAAGLPAFELPLRWPW